MNLKGLWITVLCCLLLTEPGLAASKSVLSKKTYRVLHQTQEWQEQGATEKAIKRLHTLLTETEGRPYDHAITAQAVGYAYSAKADYPSAITWLKKSIDLKILPIAVQQDIRFSLAQLYMVTERFSETISTLHTWLQHAESSPPRINSLLGNAHLQREEFKASIPYLRKAIELSPTPKKDWYQNLLVAYSEEKYYGKCTDLLHTMIKKFPDHHGYWQQLAGIEIQRKRYPQALSALELAYLQNYLTDEQNLVSLANLYVLLGAPYKAAQLLDKEINAGAIRTSHKNLELAANAWHQAKEHDRAIRALKRAITLSKSYKLSLRLSQLYLAAERWKEAVSTLNSVLKSNSLTPSQKNRTWLLLGIAQHELKNGAAAKDAFLKVTADSKQLAEARQWLAYLQQSE